MFGVNPSGIVHLSLSSDDELDAYVVNSGLSMSNVAFMRGAAVGTWLGDLVTAFMVLDMVLQVLWCCSPACNMPACNMPACG